ncbi:MAG: hypothetical protein AAFZ52_00050 [Bacteroidota bacterium]
MYIPFRLLVFFCCFATTLNAQDTLSFGGIYDLPGVEVRTTYVPVSPLAQRFTIEEVYRLPGTFYDPARLVALLPGVVQTNDQANHLSVRGNTPNANLWRINGLAVVNPNHTANAGTFYDFPTLSGGGVNAISAQLLGNSGFLAGNLPVEYGYATGGTFDLRLRPGNKTGAKYQAQAGFIGFDGMAEGPIGSSGRTSYLANARYSFTGLLADMGVDFGGEAIRFADVNLHLHQDWGNAELSAFAILGRSSNIFQGPDSTEQVITEQKELFDIDFTSNLAIYGATYTKNPRGRKTLSFGAALSSNDNERQQNFSTGRLEDEYDLSTRYLSAFLHYRRKIKDYGQWKFGAEFLRQATRLRTDRFRFDDFDFIYGFAPFVEYAYENKALNLHFGLRYPYYGEISVGEWRPEPRLSVNLRRNNQRLAFSLSSSSRAAVDLLQIDPFSLLSLRRISVLTHQLELGYGRRLLGAHVKLNVFYQFTPKDLALRYGNFLNSSSNVFELYPDSFLEAVETDSRRYGLTLEAGGGNKATGWYYRGSLTLQRAQTKQLDGSWTDDRFGARFIGKMTVGREWTGTDKKDRARSLGFNLSLLTFDGERYGRIVPESSSLFSPYLARPDLRNGYPNQLPSYFRPDLRLYKTKTRPKTTTTLALDVQNAAGIQNTANVYYDAFLDRPNERFQLGLIPVLSYRIVWR